MAKLLLLSIFLSCQSVFAGSNAKEPAEAAKLVEAGRNLFSAHRCNACHMVNSPRSEMAPSLFQKFGAQVVVDDDVTLVFDENYFKDSIMDPNKNISKGFRKGRMPVFKEKLDENEVQALLEYIKSLK